MSVTLGKQIEGASPSSIKTMAIRAIKSLNKSSFGVIADIGAGKGELAMLLGEYAEEILMVDDFEANALPPKAIGVKTDLNDFWQISNDYVDFLFSLEVIEHLENPRHFFREIKRVLKQGGYGFVTTPNNLNIFSKINFLFNGCHRFFQDSCYPAHITALNKIDLERLIKENNLQIISFYYNYEDTIPKLGKRITFRSSNFSSSIGVLFKKL